MPQANGLKIRSRTEWLSKRKSPKGLRLPGRVPRPEVQKGAFSAFSECAVRNLINFAFPKLKLGRHRLITFALDLA
jgi:hypothetical protein